MGDKKKYDVGILGVWSGCNYGSIATYYALNKVVSSMGYSVLMIDKPRKSNEPDAELEMTHSRRFANQHYNISESYKLDEMKQLNKLCKTFLMGSDQVWNYGISSNFGKSFYFDFADDDKGKVAYAASFGHMEDFAPDTERKIISNYMKKFNGISVREADGIAICKDIYKVDATHVVDPVFLADKKIFEDLAKKSRFKEKEPFIATYILDPTPEKREALLYVSEKLGLKLVNMLDGLPWLVDENKEKLALDTVSDLQVEEWLYCFKNSEFVITDSCHGASFALLFEKNLIPIANERRGSSRFKSLFNVFGISDRLVTDPKDIMTNKHLFEPIDYKKINSILALEKERCRSWLKAALENNGKKNVAFEQDMCVGCGACVSTCSVDAISLMADKYGYYRAKMDANKCVKCGKCVEICPANKLPKKKKLPTKYCYEFVATDSGILSKSSSGGIFSLLAERAFEKKGHVVGAAWERDLSVKHIMINTELDLPQLQKSKYLQSYMGNIFKDIKKQLSNDEFVLFTGCPCQVAGLHAYLGKEYNNLISVDLLCGNAPSTMFFKKYIADSFPEGVEKYEFRNKVKGWNAICVKIDTANEKNIIRTGGRDDDYQRVYHNHTMCPPHCENCKYQRLPRFGDLTIGDFWGIGKMDLKLETKQGVSIVLCNNQKGKDFFDSIPKEKIAVKKQVPLHWIGGNGYSIKNAHNYASPQRNDFYKIINDMPFGRAVDFALKPNRGSYDEIYNGSNAALQYNTAFLHFEFEPDIWEEHYINGKTVLIVKPVKARPGRYATLPLTKPLKKACKYKCEIKFQVKSDAACLNFHVKDSGSDLFQMIYAYPLPVEKDANGIVKLSFEFVANSNIYDQFMIGASQITGQERCISFTSIQIMELGD